jgi:nucleosome binding factor SPN SPT16 subunit
MSTTKLWLLPKRKILSLLVKLDLVSALALVSLTEKNCCVFLRLSVNWTKDGESKAVVVALGDTVLVEKDGTVSELTGGIPKKFKDISYVFDEEEEEDEKQKVKKNAVYHLGAGNGA